jgi:polyisoprenoid-binding protein YceI
MLEPEHWEIDGTRSKLAFTLRHLIVSEIRGEFARWGGEMWLTPEQIERSRVAVWIDLASVDTGSPERDAHLRSPEFLDVTRFSRAAFSSADVAPRSDSEATITGRLSLHGLTDQVELTVTEARSWIDDDGVMRAGYAVRGTINRQTFGLHWNQDLDVGGLVVGDEVELIARIEMVRTADAVRAPSPERPTAGAR